MLHFPVLNTTPKKKKLNSILVVVSMFRLLLLIVQKIPWCTPEVQRRRKTFVLNASFWEDQRNIFVLFLE